MKKSVKRKFKRLILKARRLIRKISRSGRAKYVALAVCVFVVALVAFGVITSRVAGSVSDVTVETDGNKQIISWNLQDDGSIYEIKISEDGETYNDLDEYISVESVRDGRYYVSISGLSCGKVYYYEITSEKIRGKLKSSSIPVHVSGVTGPEKIGFLQVSFDTMYEVDLKWTEAAGATGYEICYSEDENMKNASKIDLSADEVKTSEDKYCRYRIEGLKDGVKYYFSVDAYAQYDDTEFSGKYYSISPNTGKIKTPKLVNLREDGIDPDKPMIALTFDDGPDLGDVTEDILETLSTYGAWATFFQLGENSLERAELMKEMVSDGNEVGCHTYDHTHYGKDVKKEDIVKGNDAIEEACGVRPTLFRATGGTVTDKIRSVCKKQNQAIINWNVDTRDWETRDVESILSNIKTEVGDGDIVLMHNVYESTAEAVAEIVPWLEARGYQLVTVSQLIEYKSGSAPVAGKLYYSGSDYE